MSIVSALLELLTRFRVTRKCPLLFVREPDSLSRRARSERSYEASYRFFVSMTKGLPFGYEIDQHVCLPVLESPPGLKRPPGSCSVFKSQEVGEEKTCTHTTRIDRRQIRLDTDSNKITKLRR